MLGVSGEMWMDGGTLYAPYGLTFNKSGSANNTANSTLHMSDGLLHLGPWPGYVGLAPGTFCIGRTGTADCNMTGGTIKCDGFANSYTDCTDGDHRHILAEGRGD